LSRPGLDRASSPQTAWPTPAEVWFQRVPEPKGPKSRVHLDLVASDLDAEVERLIGLGARRLESQPTGRAWGVR